MLHDALELCDGPAVIRYPKGAARQVAEHEVGSGLSARKLRTGDGRVCILALGKCVAAADKAAADLAADGIETTVWDVRIATPLDQVMLDDAALHQHVITVEDGIRDGGVGQLIADRLAKSAATVTVLGVPVKFLAHGKPDRILANLGLDAAGVAASVRATISG